MTPREIIAKAVRTFSELPYSRRCGLFDYSEYPGELPPHVVEGPDGSVIFRGNDSAEARAEYEKACDSHHAQHILEALTSAGYRILDPGEWDKETVEKCAEVVRQLPDRRYADNVGYVTVPPNREDFATAIEATAIRALAKEKQG